MQGYNLNVIMPELNLFSKIWPCTTPSSGTAPNHSCKSLAHLKGPVVLRDKHTALPGPAALFCSTLSEFYSWKMRGILPNQVLHSLISFFPDQQNVMCSGPAVPWWWCCQSDSAGEKSDGEPRTFLHICQLKTGIVKDATAISRNNKDQLLV